jgi:nucleotide-binding universal stress UspA family protein
MFTSKTCYLDWQALSRHGLRRKKIFRSILFPIDFSMACRATATYVRDLAELTGGTVTLLHVVPWHSAWYGAADVYSGTELDETLRGLKKIQMCSLARFRDEYFDGVPCQIRVESGSVGGQIVDFAEHSGTDLIMMASRGGAANAPSLIGSIIKQVLRNASCAVWTGPHSDRLKPFAGFNSIVCALCPDEISGEYVNETTALGTIFGSKLTFVSAVAAESVRAEHCRVLTLEEEYPEAGLDQLTAGARCPVYVETGPVGHVVRHVAEIQSADLIVINRRHKSQSFDGFETHAYEIVLESPCPVLTLPEKTMAASVHIVDEVYTSERYAFAEAACC